VIELITLSQPNAVFYAALGPFLGDMLARIEIGAEIVHAPMMTWIVLLHRGEPRGWAGIFLNTYNRSVPAEFTSAYVDPNWRGRGYYNALIEKRLELAGQDRDVIVHAKACARPALKTHGFAPYEPAPPWESESEQYESLMRPGKALRFDLK
jgi:GNAT superfamily N-acetyltransferase